MPATRKGVVQSSVLPVLFKSVEGKPMSFYLRPGPLKRQLKQLITAGGGTVSNVQQPGSILLVDPEERCSIPQSATHRYVSTQYIHDCMEKNEQLNLEDYRLTPIVAQRQSARLSSRGSSPSLSEGRLPYTPQEDAAILEYVNNHKSEVGGNRLWKEMEQQRLTAHSWQSMKKRYQMRLAKNQMEDEAQTAQSEEKEVEEKAEDPDVQKPEEETASPQKHPAETDPTQVEEQSVPAGSHSENKGAEDDELQADGPLAETSDTPQAEGPHVDVQAEDEASAEEAAQPEGDEPQLQAAAPPETPPRSSNRKLKDKQKASPGPASSPRRMTRRRLELEASSSPQPLGEKLQSSSSTPPPQISERGESAVMPNQQEAGTSGEPPPKKSRGENAKPLTESESEDSDDADTLESLESDESDPEPQIAPEPKQKRPQRAKEPKQKRPKQKRPMGLLELAASEFDTGSSEDEASDQAAARKSLPWPPEGYRVPGWAPLLTSVSPAVAEPALFLPPIPESTSAMSTPHLFIFHEESQELVDPSLSAAPPHAPPAGGAAALSLTQVQLEEDMQMIRELMALSEQDLETVTKALLRTGGDTSAALELLLNPSSAPGPFWSCADDSGLLSSDPDVLRELQNKYGEEEVAKRIAFLEVER